MKSPLSAPASRRLTVSLLLASVLSLSACAPLLVGGAVMVGIDRRTAAAQLEDQTIELRASSQLSQKFGDRARFEVISFNRRVLLLGEVASPQDRLDAERIVSRVENVQAIVNELDVTAITSLSQRANDSVVTGRVKLALTNAPDIVATSFKVVTNRGTVYLLGRVTQREADRAAEVCRSVSGVSKVVRSFEIITEDELKRLQPVPSKG